MCGPQYVIFIVYLLAISNLDAVAHKAESSGEFLESSASISAEPDENLPDDESRKIIQPSTILHEISGNVDETAYHEKLFEKTAETTAIPPCEVIGNCLITPQPIPTRVMDINLENTEGSADIPIISSKKNPMEIQYKEQPQKEPTKYPVSEASQNPTENSGDSDSPLDDKLKQMGNRFHQVLARVEDLSLNIVNLINLQTERMNLNTVAMEKLLEEVESLSSKLDEKCSNESSSTPSKETIDKSQTASSASKIEDQHSTINEDLIEMARDLAEFRKDIRDTMLRTNTQCNPKAVDDTNMESDGKMGSEYVISNEAASKEVLLKSTSQNKLQLQNEKDDADEFDVATTQDFRQSTTRHLSTHEFTDSLTTTSTSLEQSTEIYDDPITFTEPILEASPHVTGQTQIESPNPQMLNHKLSDKTKARFLEAEESSDDVNSTEIENSSDGLLSKLLSQLHENVKEEQPTTEPITKTTEASLTRKDKTTEEAENVNTTTYALTSWRSLFTSTPKPAKHDFPLNCAELYSKGERRSGIYRISPQSSVSFQVYCDMESDGGGWTVIQRRMNGRVNFSRSWEDYRNGFGYVNEDYWLGLDRIHVLSAKTDQENKVSLRIDLTDWEGTSKFAKYNLFRVFGAHKNYKLVLRQYQGSAGNALQYSKNYNHNHQSFTTFDRDNDGYAKGNCGDYYQSGWWFNACFAANLNGRYYHGKYEGVQNGIYWGTWHQLNDEHNKRFSFKYVDMKIRPANFGLKSS